jgi:hypothetical protein
MSGYGMYLSQPFFDEDLEKFREAQGGGWVTKVPYGDGFVFINLKEADWETYREAFRLMKAYMRALGDTPKIPANVSSSGLLVSVTFENRSKETFKRDWSGRGQAFELIALLCQDLEKPWIPRFYPEKLEVKKADPVLKERLRSKLEVAPGKKVEKLFLLKPDEESKQRAHGFHMACVFFVVPWTLGQNIAPGTQVPFQFFNPDREIPNSIVELQVDPVAGETDMIGFVLPPMQSIRSKSGTWITEGYTYFGNILSDDRPLIMVKAIKSKPGPCGDIPRGALWKATSFAPGYKLPSKVLLYNGNPPTTGSEPKTFEGWIEYSFREENAQKAAWEATPLKEKMVVAAKLIASEDPEERAEGIDYVGKYANEAYLDVAISKFNDPDPFVANKAKRAYANIVGMTFEQHQSMLAAQKAERERIAEIARKEGRVTNILIKDSVLQRTTIGIVDGGEQNVRIEDSVVTKSNLDGKVEVKSSVVTRTDTDGDTQITDSVVVHQQTKQGDKFIEDVRVGPGPQEGETEETYEVRLAKYEKALKKAMADGKITDQESKLLEALRKKFKISDEEHEMILEMLK